MSNILTRGEDDQKVYNLLLSPKVPSVLGEENALHANGERHAHGKEKVLIVDER